MMLLGWVNQDSGSHPDAAATSHSSASHHSSFLEHPRTMMEGGPAMVKNGGQEAVPAAAIPAEQSEDAAGRSFMQTSVDRVEAHASEESRRTVLDETESGEVVPLGNIPAVEEDGGYVVRRTSIMAYRVAKRPNR